MRDQLRAAILAVTFATLAGASAIAADRHKLARSSELGIEIDAMGGEGWCRQRLSLTVTAQNAAIYSTADFTTLIKKLGRLLETECPEARHADINGLNRSSDLVFEGSANSLNAWSTIAKSELEETSSRFAPRQPTAEPNSTGCFKPPIATLASNRSGIGAPAESEELKCLTPKEVVQLIGTAHETDNPNVTVVGRLRDSYAATEMILILENSVPRVAYEPYIGSRRATGKPLDSRLSFSCGPNKTIQISQVLDALVPWGKQPPPISLGSKFELEMGPYGGTNVVFPVQLVDVLDDARTIVLVHGSVSALNPHVQNFGPTGNLTSQIIIDGEYEIFTASVGLKQFDDTLKPLFEVCAGQIPSAAPGGWARREAARERREAARERREASEAAIDSFSVVSENAPRRLADAFTRLESRFRLFFQGDFAALENAMKSDYAAAMGSLGPLGGLMRDFLPQIEQSAMDSRYAGLISQYIMAKTDIAGLCGQSASTFRVNHQMITRYRNGFGVVTRETYGLATQSQFSVPRNFAAVVEKANLTKVNWLMLPGLKRLVEAEGGCSDRLKTMEDNMLKFFHKRY